MIMVQTLDPLHAGTFLVKAQRPLPAAGSWGFSPEERLAHSKRPRHVMMSYLRLGLRFPPSLRFI